MGGCLVAAVSGKRLRELLTAPLEQRLVVSPLLDPKNQVREDQASIDIRLGSGFALVSASSAGAVDELDKPSELSRRLARLYRMEYVPFGGSLVIHPHQFILAETFEFIRLPGTVAAYVIGRSTWGRLGLIVATAAGIHPGFSGTLTLELRNLGETPLTLYPGQTIAQLFFHDVEPPVVEVGPGQYSGRTALLPRRISADYTLQKLVSLKRRFEAGVL
jgi:dCTP deaminase